MQIVVLHSEVGDDAPEDEKDTLIQVAAVSEALSAAGHSPVFVPFSLDLQKIISILSDIKPALVFNLVESVAGRGRLIHLAPSLLDHLGYPYTGSGTEALFLTSNKVMAKQIMTAAGIPSPEWLPFDGPAEDTALYDRPCIVKSVWEHASVGLDENSLVLARDSDELEAKIRSRHNNTFRDFFAERYIDGREFNVSLLGKGDRPEVLPPAEMEFVEYPPGKPRIVGYRAKWDENSFEYRHTRRSFHVAERDSSLVRTMSEIAEKCWSIFNIRGYARIDFRVDSADAPWVLEINANPCLSPDSGFVAAAKQAGYTFADLIERIIDV
ncbi:MAG: D-alanine--D-alanine ligase [Pseudomonadota bacterium]